MPTLISTPTRITAAVNKPKIIEEFIGRVNSDESRLSIEHMRSPSGWVGVVATHKFCAEHERQRRSTAWSRG
jgi:hypothetical protein